MNIAPPQVRVLVVMPKHFKASDERHLAHYWRARERIRNQWFRGFTRTVKKQFAKELGSVKNAIASSEISSIEDDVRTAIYNGKEAWTRIYNGLYVGMAQDIAPMIVQQYEGGTGKSFRPSNSKDDDTWMAYLLEYLRTVTPPKIKGLTDTTVDRVLAVIAEGMEAEDSMEDIVRRIDDLYSTSITPYRSMTIARTEVTAASNISTQKTGEYMADRYDLDITKRWITARDARVRDTHSMMEGVEVALDELFNVNGSLMLCPGDTSHGADLSEIVSCRCDVVQHVDGS